MMSPLFPSHHKPQVHEQRGNETVVSSHDMEALDERGAVVLVRHAPVEIVCYDLVDAHELETAAP